MEIIIRLYMEIIVVVYVMVFFVMNLYRKEFVVFEGCRYLGLIMNCIVIKMVIIMLVRVKFSMSWFMGVFIDLFKRIIRIIIVLLKRFIRIMIEKVILRLMYFVGNMVFCKFKLVGFY